MCAASSVECPPPGGGRGFSGGQGVCLWSRPVPTCAAYLPRRPARCRAPEGDILRPPGTPARKTHQTRGRVGFESLGLVSLSDGSFLMKGARGPLVPLRIVLRTGVGHSRAFGLVFDSGGPSGSNCGSMSTGAPALAGRRRAGFWGTHWCFLDAVTDGKPQTHLPALCTTGFVRRGFHRGGPRQTRTHHLRFGASAKSPWSAQSGCCHQTETSAGLDASTGCITRTAELASPGSWILTDEEKLRLDPSPMPPGPSWNSPV